MLTFALMTVLPGCSASSRKGAPVTLSMWHNYGGEMQQSMDMLIDEFNSTVGKEKGILIDVTAISSSSELNKSLAMIANGDPGAPDMPDIFTGYPKVAVQFQQQDMLANLDSYFTQAELSEYVEAFVEEGRLSDGGLYVFPIAKSTEVLYVNQTLFDAFSAATGADAAKLESFEGIAELSRQYYDWCGRQFFASDSWFNFAEVGMVQLGDSIFEAETLDLDGEIFSHIFRTIYSASVEGGIIMYDGYSSDLSKTGDIVCSIGSSAGILFYGDTITYPNGMVEQVEYSILPYPTFEGGSRTALQRGGGLMVARSGEEKEYAACEFIKWLSAPEQNMRFVAETGYLPVTRQAFEEDMAWHIEEIENDRVRMMLSSVMEMYKSYSFFTAPYYPDFDSDSETFEKKLYQILTQDRERFLAGEEVAAAEALAKLR